MNEALYAHSQFTAEGVRDVDPSTVHTHRGDVRLVDVREPAEFTGDLGHIAGASLAPLSTVVAHAATWSRDEHYVVVCRSGRRSAAAARQLAALGFGRVLNLRGGMLAWTQAGLPVER